MKALAWLACLSLLGACASTAPVPADAVRQLAPTGKLRAAINFGNPVLVNKDPASGEPRGVTVHLARELARRPDVPVELVTFDAAGKVFDALGAGAWDVAFLAIEPARAAQIDFTAPYVVIEGTYLVRVNSPLRAIGDFDREGVRIAVGNKSAYDLYLTRMLERATLVRVPTSAAAIELNRKDDIQAAAGIRQPLVKFAAANPGHRVIDVRFMAIEQAMGTPKGRPAGARFLREFVEEMKASGFVARALARSGQADATVAPPAR
jgi:polar amino acid transport system substrate-binding protein